MTFGDLKKSGVLVIAMLVLVVLLVPFAIEQVGEATMLYSFPATKWVKGLFSSDNGQEASKAPAKVDWERQLKDLQAFSEWVDGRPEIKISIVRPDVFQIVRADANPATESRFSWKLQLLTDKLDLSAAQVGNKLTLICEPEDKVSGRIGSVKSLGGGEKGFLVTVDGVRGEGKIGLSYEGLPPVYYDVKLRRMWLVPVASCRSAMKGRYESAVFFPGMDKGLPEGAVISPGEDKCGYRVLSISDYCVWFEAFYGAEPPQNELPQSIWPDFSRVDTMAPTPPPGRLIFGKSRCFWPGDAIKLPSSETYLMVDDFLAGRAVVFRLLDSAMRPVRELLCVIVREK
ncbi:MAG: hypothetical protein E7049_03970 [Lentisphaerae bacterium]|nr:hypothetical protein [Lentisphaerota bacterium]